MRPWHGAAQGERSPTRAQRGAVLVEYAMVLAALVLVGVQVAALLTNEGTQVQSRTAVEIGREQVWLPNTTASTTTTTAPTTTSSTTSTTAASTTPTTGPTSTTDPGPTTSVVDPTTTTATTLPPLPPG